MESTIRETLAKLDKLSQIIPEQDPRAVKARLDVEELNQKFGQILFEKEKEEEEAADTDLSTLELDDNEVDEIIAKESAEREI